MASLSPRNEYILFSTASPPAVQRIPWPSDDDEEDIPDPSEGEDGRPRRLFSKYDHWVLSELEFEWLIDTEGWTSNTRRL